MRLAKPIVLLGLPVLGRSLSILSKAEGSPATMLLLLLAISFSWGAEPPQLPTRPLVLQDCVRIALAYNPQIVSSRQGVISAEAGLERARSGYWPQLSLTWTEGLTSVTSFLSVGGRTVGFAGTNTREDVDFVLRQSLWQRGRSESVKENKASFTAAANNYEETQQGLIESVARDYYAVLAAQQLMEVADARVRSAQDHLRQVKARIEVGDAAQVEILPAEEDLASAQLGRIDAYSDSRLAFAQLKNTMGLSPETQLELMQTGPAEEHPLPSFQEAMRTALASRPDVGSARASLEKSRYALAGTKIRRGPLVELFGQYNQGYTEWLARDPSWQVLMSLSWPLFDGGATRADETAARAGSERLRADLQSLVNQVGLEVESALVEVERTHQRVQATAKSVAAAEARLAAAEGKYREGMAIFLEVSDALSALTDAKANQVRARYDHEMAQVRLRKALGILRPPD